MDNEKLQIISQNQSNYDKKHGIYSAILEQ